MVVPWCRVRSLGLVGPLFIIRSMVTHYCRGSLEGFCGVSMVEPWSVHDGSSVPPWWNDLDALLGPCLHEPSVVFPWRFRGGAMGAPLDCATLLHPSGENQSRKSFVSLYNVLEKTGRIALFLFWCSKACPTSTPTTCTVLRWHWVVHTFLWSYPTSSNRFNRSTNTDDNANTNANTMFQRSVLKKCFEQAAEYMFVWPL